MSLKQPHTSVLLEEILAIFSQNHLKIFVDGTLGAGGHALALLKAHPESEVFLGIDQDPLALAIAKERLEPLQRNCQFFHANFEKIPELLEAYQGQIDGILLDLGVSSMQLDRAEKGFSFSKEGPLDMRMNPDQALTAEEIVNEWSEEELGRIFRDYGEESKWKKAAFTIVQQRKGKRIKTTTQLVELLRPIIGPKGKIHPLTLIFQGLRIAVNRELEVLQTFLPLAIRLLRKGGRLAVISFHSLEDRIVKQVFKNEASDRIEDSAYLKEPIKKIPSIEIITKKPLEASFGEIKKNPRSRSAKLRVVEKL